MLHHGLVSEPFMLKVAACASLEVIASEGVLLPCLLAFNQTHRPVMPSVAASGSCVRVLTAQTSCISCLGFSPDGQQLAAGTEDGTVAVYDLGSARRWAGLGLPIMWGSEMSA